MGHVQESLSVLIQFILGALAVIVLFLCVVLFHEYEDLRQADLMNMHAPWLHRAVTAQPPTPDSIQSWMTYDYIGHIYGLPPEYLQSTLALVDADYPHVSIAESAPAQQVTSAELTAEVKAAVNDYLLTKKP